MPEEIRWQKQNPHLYDRAVRCPIHKKMIGKYDGRVGIINTTYYCSKCKREYTFTVEREERIAHNEQRTD